MTSDHMLKVCGITRAADALHAVHQGATALGFVFWSRSPRVVTPEHAARIIAELPVGVMTVGVFVNESVQGVRAVIGTTGIGAIQLHGDESGPYLEAFDRLVLRSVTLGEIEEASATWPANTTLLLDTFDPERRGGTGVSVDWTRAAAAARRRPVVLAGGLTPENVEQAIQTVRPSGVDVSSGVEAAPGVKDPDKVSSFLARAKRAFAQLQVSSIPDTGVGWTR